MNEKYLSRRELDVMQILWNASKPLIASEIVSEKEGLTIPTVHTVLKKLLDKKYIEVANVVQSGKVLARSYKAVKKQDELIKNEIESFMKETKNPLSFSKGVIAALLNGAVDDDIIIEEIEKLIVEKKKEHDN